jgi:hypothetical protein
MSLWKKFLRWLGIEPPCNHDWRRFRTEDFSSIGRMERCLRCKRVR